MLSHYHTEVDLSNENNSHTNVLRMVGFNKRVLEAGCASGHVSEMLCAQGCVVVGVEIDETVARTAEQWTERVIVGDFDEGVLWQELEGEDFDAIIFGDVLEHLKDPLATLREATKHLRVNGCVIMSIPNIAHADIKIALLNGSFPYSESGLLDRTHVHFFTKQSLLDMIREAGLAATEISRVTAPVFSTELGVQRSDVDDQVLKAFLQDRESETYQFVVRAVRDDATRSINSLSKNLVDMTDRIIDDDRRHLELMASYVALQESHQALMDHHAGEMLEYARLMGQLEKLKRFVPTRLLRYFRLIN